MIIAIQLIVLLFSIILHEIAHGYAALSLGDTTAKDAHRLTLNPLPHIDFLGSILLPFIAFISGSKILFGWAKPVPVNPNNFENPHKGMMLVGICGPITNIAIAVICALILRLIATPTDIPTISFLYLNFTLLTAVQINLVLAIFNLIPIPPLDGSRILYYFLPEKFRYYSHKIEIFGFIILIILAYLGILNILLSFLLTPILNLLLP